MSAFSIRRRRPRITVALKDSVVEADVLGSVARLAREISAELSGLFLQDIDLLRVAELPLAIEISRVTSAPRRVEVDELGRQLASQAAAAERIVARAAQEAGVTWSFSIARGALTTLLAKAAGESDYTLVPAVRRAPWGYLEISGMPARRRPSLVAVVVDRSAAARRALDIARRLAAAEQRPLSVILTSASERAGERLRAETEAALAPQPARFSLLVGVSTSRVAQVVREQGTGLLVVPARGIAVVTDPALALRGDLGCAALLVR